MPDNVKAKLTEILVDILDIEEETIEPASTLKNIGATSIDIVEISAEVENEFNIDISDEEASKFTTFENIVSIIKGKIS